MSRHYDVALKGCEARNVSEWLRRPVPEKRVLLHLLVLGFFQARHDQQPDTIDV